MLKVFILMSLVIVSSFACRDKVATRTKSIVGLEADLDPDILKGAAPSFQLLQKWFQGELPVDNAKAQAGNINYNVHGDFTQQSLNTLPANFRDRLTGYLRQQGDIIHTFQLSLNDRKKLKSLLDVEAAEMADILMALIDPGHKPRTRDLLAQLIAYPAMRSFIDRYSVELLEKLYVRSQRSIIVNLPREQENFAKLLSDAYLTSSGANDKFKKSLADDCGKVQAMLSSVGSSPKVACQASSSGTQLTGSQPGDISARAKSLSGSPGRVFGIFGALTGKRSYTAAGAPQLQIFASRDPNAGNPFINGGGSNPSPSPNPSPGPDPSPSPNPAPNPSPLPSPPPSPDPSPRPNPDSDPEPIFGGFFARLFQSLFGRDFNGSGGNQNMNLADGTLSLAQPSEVYLPPPPKGLCKGESGLRLVVCQRYIEALPSRDQISKRHKVNSSRSVKGGTYKSASGYSFFLVSNYATAVQDQGREGACSAYGLAHTLGILGRIKGKSGEYDAKQIWDAQNHETYMEKAIEAAKNMDFDGLKLTAADAFDVTIDSLKQKLDAGIPVYIGSMVSPAWQNTGRDGKIDCAAAGESGHAYSIVGYDDQTQQLIMKNSWGDSWGDAGYGYLSYSCLGNMDPNGFDLTLQ